MPQLQSAQAVSPAERLVAPVVPFVVTRLALASPRAPAAKLDRDGEVRPAVLEQPHLIQEDGCLIRPDQVRERCRASRAWLSGELAASDMPTLVVTHTAPSGDGSLVNPRFLDDPLTPAFHNAFDSLVRKPVVAWIFGHHHYSLDVDVNGVRVVSNQRGYPGEGCDFGWERTIEIRCE